MPQLRELAAGSWRNRRRFCRTIRSESSGSQPLPSSRRHPQQEQPERGQHAPRDVNPPAKLGLVDLLRSPARNSWGGYHDESTPTLGGESLMRGRKPLPLSLAPGDLPILQEVARSRSLPFYQVQHARVLLAIVEGQRVQEVAAGMRCDPSTVWRLCRRYEQGGLDRLLADLARCGSPPQISPPPARPDRRTGLLGAGGPGAAHHSLEQRRPGSPSRHRWDRPDHQPGHGSPHLERGSPPTSPDAIRAHLAAR